MNITINSNPINIEKGYWCLDSKMKWENSNNISKKRRRRILTKISLDLTILILFRVKPTKAFLIYVFRFSNEQENYNYYIFYYKRYKLSKELRLNFYIQGLSPFSTFSLHLFLKPMARRYICSFLIYIPLNQSSFLTNSSAFLITSWSLILNSSLLYINVKTSSKSILFIKFGYSNKSQVYTITLSPSNTHSRSVKSRHKFL